MKLRGYKKRRNAVIRAVGKLGHAPSTPPRRARVIRAWLRYAAAGDRRPDLKDSDPLYRAAAMAAFACIITAMNHGDPGERL